MSIFICLSNSSEFETNNALSDGQVIFDGNRIFESSDALYIGMEFMRQQKGISTKKSCQDEHQCTQASTQDWRRK